jgi:hypothetical protein
VFPQWLGLLISPEGDDITARRTVYLRPWCEHLKSLGIERAMFHTGGWNRMGYDSEYPDILPALRRRISPRGTRRRSPHVFRT